MNNLHKVLLAFVFIIGAVALLPSDPANALSVTQGNHTSVPASPRTLCPAGAPRVDFSMQISNISLNTNPDDAAHPNGGRMSYDVTVRYRRCHDNTAAYAIYNPTGRFCKYSGDYGGPGDGSVDAYDCVKYVGPNYSTELTCGGGRTNEQCVVNSFENENNGGIIEQTQPSAGVKIFTRSFSTTIPNWNTRRQTSGSYTMPGGTMCEYYKYGSNLQNVFNGRCINNPSVTVRWNSQREWNAVAQISRGTADIPANKQVGDTLRWNHWFTNAGPDSTTATVRYGNVSPAGPWLRAAGLADGGAAPQRQSTYTITAADIGRNICRRTYVNPGDHGGGQESSAQLCYQIPYDFQLTPIINTPDSVYEAGGEPVTVNPSIQNGGTTASRPVQWRVNRLAYSSEPSSTMGSGSQDACAYYTAASRIDCTTSPIASGTAPTVPTSDLVLNTIEDSSIPPYPPGTRVCYSLSIYPWQDGNATWRHSTLACVTSGKKPKFQVHGGDVRVHEGDITTSTSRLDGRTYGSWGEYGAAVQGVNNLFGSGAGLVNGNSSTQASPAAFSRLTFANVNSSGATRLGNYTLGALSNSLREGFVDITAQPGMGNTHTVDAGSGRRVLDFGNRNITVTGAEGVNGTTIIRTTGTVTITSNITLNAGANYTAIAEIPQVVIVAGNIRIEPGVTQLDAWLLAEDTITTCTAGEDANLTIAICNQPLAVNGPVQTARLNLYRTSGGDMNSPTVPAEVFRLPAYSYLWAQHFQARPDYVTTTLITELPPRF